MKQRLLIDSAPASAVPLRVVNVASVPQRSPFRYPGGKTWLIPRVRQWLASLDFHPQELIEPFAGGASVALAAAFEGHVDRSHLVELDPAVAAVWQTIFCEDFRWLARRVRDFRLSAEAVNEVLESRPTNTKELAFQTLLRNRVSHGGIMAPGSGLIKNGEAGKGLGSRWYASTLERRILSIGHINNRFQITCGDGLEAINLNKNRSDVVFFIDPPYTVSSKRAGKRLYPHNELNHDDLFAAVKRVGGDFLMTYDNANEVREYAAKYGFDTELVAMTNTHHATMTELLIGRDLEWARYPPGGAKGRGRGV